LFAVAVVSTALLAPATARGDGLSATSQAGVVAVGYAAPLGSQVNFRERTGTRSKVLGVATVTATTKPPTAVLLEAVKWRCDRVVRRFEATATAPDGSSSQDSYDVRTPSCANRLKLSVPRRVARGARVRVSVQDGWKNGGVKPRLCIIPPRGRRSCRVLAFPRAVDVAGRHFRASKRGLWRVELRLSGHRVRAAVAVGGAHYRPPAPLPTLLATGDSTMQGLDSALADRLADRANVRSDLHAGTGVSRGVEWLTRAAAQTKKYRQRTTVISVGDWAQTMQTPDGATRECCDELWAEEYRRRARVMMTTYIRGGKARVFWMAIPIARHPELAAVSRVVNAAVLRAAEGLSGVRIVRLDSIFTPNGYREYMPYRGRTVRVRQSDGAHLTAVGLAIAAEAVDKAMREAPH